MLLVNRYIGIVCHHVHLAIFLVHYDLTNSTIDGTK